MKGHVTLGFALAILVAPLAAEAEQAAKAYQIGAILHGGSYRAAIGGLRDGLRTSGLEDGKHWVLDVRETKGDLNAVEEAARELARGRVDLLYTLAGSVTGRAVRATNDLPIVFAVGSDRSRSGSSKA
jgi:putative ABC transport system substrate-binding protein